MKKLLVNADDWGLHPSINQAIIDCANIGSVNSVSVSVNGQTLDMKALKDLYEKGIHIGLHLTWVGEPWITKKINILNWQDFLIYYIINKKSFLKSLMSESEIQLNTLLNAGIIPSHIDSHQHLHAIPKIWQYVNSMASNFSACRVRSCCVDNENWTKRGMSGTCLQKLAHHNTKTETTFFKCAGIRYSGNNSLSNLTLELNENISDFLELIVHPGKSNEKLNQKYSNWNYNWANEYNTLMSSDFLLLIKGNNYVMC